MPEINIGPSEPSGGESSSGGVDIEGMLDQLESVQERLEENPKLAQMFGVDPSDFLPGEDPAGKPAKTGGPEAQTPDGEPVTLDSGFLQDVLDGLVEAGYGDYSIEQLATFVEENPGMVDQMIQEHA